MVSPSYVILNFAVLSSNTVPQTGSLIDICCLFASRIDCAVHPFMVSGVLDVKLRKFTQCFQCWAEVVGDTRFTWCCL
jgi:hypothetical protein